MQKEENFKQRSTLKINDAKSLNTQTNLNVLSKIVANLLKLICWYITLYEDDLSLDETEHEKR